jgi:hypothetical protein
MCIISNSKKFIFVHVPKCAGTSLTSYYSEYSTCQDIEIGGTQIGEILQPYFIKRFGLSKHSTIEEIGRALGGEVYKDFFSFGFSRNPYDRVVSVFTFLRKWNGWDGHAELKATNNVNDFVKSKNFMSDGVDRILKSQIFWLGLGKYGNAYSVNYVAKIENILDEIKKINSIMGVDNNIMSLPRINSSRDLGCAIPSELRLDAHSCEIILERYKEDFDVLGYSYVCEVNSY